MVARSFRIITRLAMLSSISPIILVGSDSFFFSWTIVLNPGILKSLSVFTALVSVSVRKIMLRASDLTMSFSSCSLIIRPLRIFQLPTPIFFLFVTVLNFFAVFNTASGTGSTEAGFPIEIGSGSQVEGQPG